VKFGRCAITSAPTLICRRRPGAGCVRSKRIWRGTHLPGRPARSSPSRRNGVPAGRAIALPPYWWMPALPTSRQLVQQRSVREREPQHHRASHLVTSRQSQVSGHFQQRLCCLSELLHARQQTTNAESRNSPSLRANTGQGTQGQHLIFLPIPSRNMCARTNTACTSRISVVELCLVKLSKGVTHDRQHQRQARRQVRPGQG
jgi:hypothetical protein